MVERAHSFHLPARTQSASHPPCTMEPYRSSSILSSGLVSNCALPPSAFITTISRGLDIARVIAPGFHRKLRPVRRIRRRPHLHRSRPKSPVARPSCRQVSVLAADHSPPPYTCIVIFSFCPLQ